jgi:hypothetical protein
MIRAFTPSFSPRNKKEKSEVAQRDAFRSVFSCWLYDWTAVEYGGNTPILAC